MSVLARLRGAGKYQIDPIVVSLVSLQVLVSSYLAVRYSEVNPYVSIISLIFMSLTFAGIIMHHFFAGGVKFDTQLIGLEKGQILTSLSLGFMLVLISQTIVFKTTAQAIILATIIETKLFYLTAGVSEEMFFRYYIQTKVEQSLPKFFGPLLPILVTSLLFMVYHFTVYGAMVSALYAVFFSSLVLCLMYWMTKRLSVPMLIHVLVNFVAG